MTSSDDPRMYQLGLGMEGESLFLCIIDVMGRCIDDNGRGQDDVAAGRTYIWVSWMEGSGSGAHWLEISDLCKCSPRRLAMNHTMRRILCIVDVVGR